MPSTIAYEDAVDLLDGDHKLVQKLFLDYQALHESARLPPAGNAGLKICQDLERPHADRGGDLLPAPCGAHRGRRR